MKSEEIMLAKPLSGAPMFPAPPAIGHNPSLSYCDAMMHFRQGNGRCGTPKSRSWAVD
jgi:hypothetical protein